MTKFSHHFDRDAALRGLLALTACLVTQGDLEAALALLLIVSFVAHAPGAGPNRPAI